MRTIESKSQIKAAMTGGVYHCPADLGLPFPTLATLEKAKLDFGIVFLTQAADMVKLARSATQVPREDGVLWCCHPKSTGAIKTDISRGSGWSPVTDQGFEGCRQIAIDETWSAIRFREPRFSQKRT